MKLKLSVLDKNLSAKDLVEIVKESAKEMYSSGASWNGQVIIGSALGVVLIGALVYSIWWGASRECVASEVRYTCWNDSSNCFYTGGSNSTYSYDIWGNLVTPGYTCYGPPQTVCGNREVCVEYQRK
jgi:hypothetical protein